MFEHKKDVIRIIRRAHTSQIQARFYNKSFHLISLHTQLEFTISDDVTEQGYTAFIMIFYSIV